MPTSGESSQMKPKSFILWLDFGHILPIFLHVCKSIQKSVSFDSIMIKHHPSIIDTIAPYLMAHIPNFNAWVWLMIAVPNINNKHMDPMVDLLSDQLCEHHRLAGCFPKMTYPNLHRSFMRSMKHKFLCFRVICSRSLDSLHIGAMR